MVFFKLFNGCLDVLLLVGAIAEGTMRGVFTVAEPIVARFLHLEAYGPVVNSLY